MLNFIVILEVYDRRKPKTSPVFTTGVNWQQEMLNFTVILEIYDSQTHK